MTPQEIEQLADQAHNEADHLTFGNPGLDWSNTFHQRFAAMVLERAAKVCDVTPPEPFRPSIEAAHALRNMAKGLG